MKIGFCAAFLILVVVAPLSGQTADFEPILLPISLIKPAPGAFGSLWATEFWVSAGSSDIRFLQTGGCLACPPTIHIAANRSLSFESGGAFPGQPAGAILYLQRSTAASAVMNLRVRDLSRQSLTWGTELPVVREGSFRTGSLMLTNVPLEDRFRQTLRIYDPDAHNNARFTISIADAASGDLLVERTIVAQPGIFSGSLPIIPSVAEVSSLRGLFTELPNTGRVRITITPQDEVQRFWAFVSVTNNETQHVTTITPQ